MAFDGDEGEEISLEEAAAWLANYSSENPSEIRAHTTGKNKLNSILNQDGCVGIRTYYAIDGNGDKCLVMVGVDASENDLEEGIILDRSLPCPTRCGTGVLADAWKNL